jgi:hypothetical protein
MNDDAKYLFFISGFVGFLFFYLISFLLDKDLLVALIKGSLGCLVVGLSTRYILGYALKHTSPVLISGSKNNIANAKDSNNGFHDKQTSKEQTLSELAAATNVEAVNKNNVVPEIKLNQ